ncbi:hypothetical protein V501_01894 [Pseudogymnoascus sp. VKM F-4519 (FW-2642)]|nr:hypothetical protein V500_03155 [Pseudogymnoascus sp. VKM F-4518 (FW-2643)]KFZ17103.1 hypothetical protein V501_01894 [Pseudogymnoascus sp. VKM F-4519 (FW-2642)]
MAHSDSKGYGVDRVMTYDDLWNNAQHDTINKSQPIIVLNDDKSRNPLSLVFFREAYEAACEAAARQQKENSNGKETRKAFEATCEAAAQQQKENSKSKEARKTRDWISQNPVLTKLQNRRIQNRSAQRAFRERAALHLESVENALESAEKALKSAEKALEEEKSEKADLQQRHDRLALALHSLLGSSRTRMTDTLEIPLLASAKRPPPPIRRRSGPALSFNAETHLKAGWQSIWSSRAASLSVEDQPLRKESSYPSYERFIYSAVA